MLSMRFSCIFTVILPSIVWFLIVGIIAIAVNPMKRITRDSDVLISKKVTVALLVKENDTFHDRRKNETIKDSYRNMKKTTNEMELVPLLTTTKENDTSIYLSNTKNSRQKYLIGPVIENKIFIVKKLIFQLQNVQILVNKVYKIAKQVQLTIIIYISPIEPDLPVNSTRTTTIFTIPAMR